jgi:hypothetical protein
VPDVPAEIGQRRALTREPDTVNTVVGKDADMGYMVSHCTFGRVCNAILFFEVTVKTAHYRISGSFPTPTLKPSKYTKYSFGFQSLIGEKISRCSCNDSFLQRPL